MRGARYLLALAALLVALPCMTDSGAAQTVAPVQVEITTLNRAFSYDCWPIGNRRFVTPEPEPDDAMTMTVYLTYPSGIAGYACDLVGEAKVIPILPRVTYWLVSY